jgi:histidinol-phosphate/aromatic aminotransferase/cobyric acid decarboxylase-like protein
LEDPDCLWYGYLEKHKNAFVVQYFLKSLSLAGLRIGCRLDQNLAVPESGSSASM